LKQYRLEFREKEKEQQREIKWRAQIANPCSQQQHLFCLSLSFSFCNYKTDSIHDQSISLEAEHLMALKHGKR
jgi:hypothetical protein